MPKPYVPNDHWSRRAAEEGYRARSVYKLQELDERFKLLQPGMTVLDLGAAPGSWLQYVSQQIGEAGKAIGFDLQAIHEVAPNVSVHRLDITDAVAMERALDEEEVGFVDLVLSDAAPNTSGVRDVDQWRSVELAQAVLAVAARFLKKDGRCALKVFRGGDFDELVRDIKTRGVWRDVRITKVQASRDRSREVYLVLTKRV
ncbi:MAG: RlmE family RNA methyltransferase [Candidatus Peribacteraceae bacterium]|nr:RlmE family RNA methyltransferase [Candidatus Peribacteraceae bacterium]